MTKSISKQNKDIISKLQAGMSPAQISIEYDKIGKSVPVSHCRMVKMLVDADMTDQLKEVPKDFTYPSSREYSRRQTEAYKTTLAKHGLNEGDYKSVCLSADRTYYTVKLFDGTSIKVDSGFEYFVD